MLKRLFMTTVALSAVLTANVVFDLGKQQLYYPHTKLVDSNGDPKIDQYVEATYDIGDVLVSTALTSIGGYYRPAPYRVGYFGVNIKEPKAKSAITFSMYCYLNNDGCSIQLLDEESKALNISFDSYWSPNGYGQISIDGENKKGVFPSSHATINGSIEIDESKVVVTINGKYKFNVKKPEFKLKKLNISLATENSKALNYTDKLTSLTIANSD